MNTAFYFLAKNNFYLWQVSTACEILLHATMYAYSVLPGDRFMYTRQWCRSEDDIIFTLLEISCESDGNPPQSAVSSWLISYSSLLQQMTSVTICSSSVSLELASRWIHGVRMKMFSFQFLFHILSYCFILTGLTEKVDFCIPLLGFSRVGLNFIDGDLDFLLKAHLPFQLDFLLNTLKSSWAEVP